MRRLLKLKSLTSYSDGIFCRRLIASRSDTNAVFSDLLHEFSKKNIKNYSKIAQNTLDFLFQDCYIVCEDINI